MRDCKVPSMIKAEDVEGVLVTLMESYKHTMWQVEELRRLLDLCKNDRDFTRVHGACQKAIGKADATLDHIDLIRSRCNVDA